MSFSSDLKEATKAGEEYMVLRLTYAPEQMHAAEKWRSDNLLRRLTVRDDYRSSAYVKMEGMKRNSKGWEIVTLFDTASREKKQCP